MIHHLPGNEGEMGAQCLNVLRVTDRCLSVTKFPWNHFLIPENISENCVDHQISFCVQLRNSLCGEEAFQVAGHKESDLVSFGGLAVASTDLQDAPASTGEAVVQEAVRIPFFLQHPLLQQDRLVLLVPVRGG